MNRRFLAMALAGVMAIGAFFTGAAPASLIGDDVSVVSASANSYISFDKTYYNLKVGEKAAPTLDNVVINGKRLVRSDLTWRSIDTDIATVDASGIITAVASGWTEIEAKYENRYAYIEVHVVSDEGIKSIVNQTVEVGGTITITPEMKKGTAITEKEFWTNSNGETETKDKVETGKLISVNTETGVVTGIAVGTATVCYRVKAGDEWYWGSVEVTVTDKAGTVAKAEDGSGDYKVADPAKKEVSFAAPANTKKVVIPEKVVINGVTYKVTKVEDGAFKNNKKAVSVRLPESIKQIGANAFSGATKLKNVDMSATQVSEIGANAFSGTAPKEVIINGDNLKKVGKNAFKFKKTTKVYIESSSSKVYKKAAKLVKKNGKKVKTIEQD